MSDDEIGIMKENIGEMHLNTVLLFRILFWKRRECTFSVYRPFFSSIDAIVTFYIDSI